MGLLDFLKKGTPVQDPNNNNQQTNMPNADGAQAADTYTVKSGDSLSKIAKQFYGDAQQWKKIYEANRDQINNPDLIHPGQTFKIPRG